MNADDIFKKLSRGISFNRKRFRDDAENLGIIAKAKTEEKEVNAADNIFITALGKWDRKFAMKWIFLCDSSR